MKKISIIRLTAGGLMLMSCILRFIYCLILKVETSAIKFNIALYFFTGVGIICVLAGVLTLIRIRSERTSVIIISTLVNCSITYSAYRSDYYLVKGISLEGTKNTFGFHGKDRAVIKQALAEGKNNFTIRYYKAREEYMRY